MSLVSLPSHADEPRMRVLALLRAHGWNTTSFQILERGFAYWFDDAEDACVAYVDTGRAWVAAGAPVAPSHAIGACALRFVEAARRLGRRACFFAVEDRFAFARELSSMPIGEQPSWDPSRWADVVASDRRLREQLRRARAKGVTVRRVGASALAAADAPLRADIEDLVRSWSSSRRMAPMGFMVDVQPFDFAEERRFFAAEQDGRMIALLVAVPVYRRKGWLFEDLLRVPHAPNGSVELLVDAGMRAVGEEGASYVTLGLAPLAGDVTPWLRFLRAGSAALYDFDGVRRFKAKLRPDEWVPIHLAWPSRGSGNLALLDALAAFTMRPRDGHERASFVRFGLETLFHAPAAAVRLFALLLVPWTIALALAPTARFFPSRTVQIAWIVFDVLVTLSMLSLARRWRSGLARALAVATSIDATLTLFEVVTDARLRATSFIDAVVLASACLGPLLATSLLWGVLFTRRLPRRGAQHPSTRASDRARA